jgi:divalent metal cation (Fe/Co/Zn/Cd) transporter
VSVVNNPIMPDQDPTPSESTRTVLVALAADLAIGLAKAGAAVLTGSAAMAAEASDSLTDVATGVSSA